MQPAEQRSNSFRLQHPPATTSYEVVSPSRFMMNYALVLLQIRIGTLLLLLLFQISFIFVCLRRRKYLGQFCKFPSFVIFPFPRWWRRHRFFPSVSVDFHSFIVHCLLKRRARGRCNYGCGGECGFASATCHRIISNLQVKLSGAGAGDGWCCRCR